MIGNRMIEATVWETKVVNAITNKHRQRVTSHTLPEGNASIKWLLKVVSNPDLCTAYDVNE